MPPPPAANDGDADLPGDPLVAVSFTEMAAFLGELSMQQAMAGVCVAARRGGRDYDFPTRARISRHRYNARMLAIAQTWLTRMSPREAEARGLMVP